MSANACMHIATIKCFVLTEIKKYFVFYTLKKEELPGMHVARVPGLALHKATIYLLALDLSCYTLV